MSQNLKNYQNFGTSSKGGRSIGHLKTCYKYVLLVYQPIYAAFGRTSAPFVWRGKNRNQVLKAATLIARNANDAVVGSCGVWVWQASGSVTMKTFSHLICFIKTFYKLCTFTVRFAKIIIAINCIIVQYKRCSFPSTLTGDTTLVRLITTWGLILVLFNDAV